MTEHWAFQIFLVTNHRAYDPANAAEQAFDFEAFKRQMLKFRLPHQEFSFTLNTLEQSADKTLAIAFRSSLHTANVVTGSLGLPTVETRTYLDSGHLRQRLAADAGNEGSFLFFFDFIVVY